MASEGLVRFRFGDLLEIPVRNGLYKSKEFHGRGSKIVNMGELFSYPRLGDVEMRRLEVSAAELDRHAIKNGDLLFARRSLVAEGAGRCCLVTRVTEPTVFESSIIRARPDPERASSAFLYYLFSSPQGRDLMRSIARQMAVSGITGTDLAKLEVPLPSIETQRSVAAVLGSMDDRIDLLRQANTTLEAIARAVFKSWFVDFDPVRAKAEGREPDGMDSATATLFPSEFEASEQGLIPAGWRAGRLGELCQNIRMQAKPETLDSSTPYIGLEHMPRRSIALADAGTAGGLASAKFCYAKNDVLFGKLRPYFHKVGVASHTGVCSTDILVIRATGPCWFGYTTMQLSSDAIIAYATRLSNGAKMPRSSWRDVANYKLVIPSEALAVAFDALVRGLVARIHTNIDVSCSLASLRDTLLPRLISGELRLPEAKADFVSASA